MKRLAWLLLIIFLVGSASAETTKAWIVCQPGDYVNARISASSRSECAGRFDGGDVIWVTGKQKGGFDQIDASLEVTIAWVCSGYIVYDQPEYLDGMKMTVRSNGRVAARKRIGGQRRKWLHDGDVVKVYWKSDEWCVTSEGFVKTEFLQ